ncbi:hypothetical protein SAMN05216266_12924 [Amycolatopsis marina]|uniref:Uncharacterized protein n=1 Tax=Amycolatopsis marina TaxID=490629 RepID=A0A1I1CIK6_9PSEU|nr:hypothetical protein [Amycolatopsis marina]SFB61882.1 hypothetical protein SAMN05216266_12924 [Amycolatopsis marina]
MTKRHLRRALAALAGASLIATTAAVPAIAQQPSGFDFTACPAIPAGADPAKWRCEVLISTGTLSFGRIRELPLREMRLTFAEGTLDGRFAQVFGSLEAEPTPLPGAPRTTVQLRYAGYSDFESNDERKGEIDLALRVRGPLLAPGCTIGEEQNPIHSEIQQVGPTEVISADPPVLRFTSVDEQLAVPAARHCGRLGRSLNRWLDLPASSGENVLRQTTHVGLRPYTAISAG